MARKRRKATLHSAGRTVEQDLLARANALAEDPSLATPACEGSCVFFCPIRQARGRIARIHAARDSEKKLLSFASRGNRLARAYAATLALTHVEKLPYVAELRLPTGPVPYVTRGKAAPFELVGLQHLDDRELRLLSVARFVKARKLHVYSAERGLVCTAKRASPPKDFVEEQLTDLGLAPRGDRWTCEHGGTAAGDALVLDWRAASVTAEICAECALDENSLLKMARHIASPKPRGEFVVRVQLAALKGDGAPAETGDVPAEAAAEYAAGKLHDAGLLARARLARTHALRAKGVAFVAGDRWFGTDARAFIDALQPTDAERAALEGVLPGIARAVIVEKATATRALAEIWAEKGLDALAAAASGDRAAAEALYRAEMTTDEIGDAVKRAAQRGATARVDAALPKFKTLPPAAAAADAISRAHRAKGRDEAVRIALKRADGAKERGVALAFLRALGGASGQDWKFSRVDQELADVLADDAKSLLDCPPREYAARLDALARKAGGAGIESA